MFKKVSVFLLFFSVCLVSLGVTETSALINGVKNTGGSGGVDAITEKIDEAGGSIYGAAKEVAMVGSVLALVVAGFLMKFMGGNAQALAGAKSKILWIFIGLFVVFGAVMIVGTFLQWMDMK